MNNPNQETKVIENGWFSECPNKNGEYLFYGDTYHTKDHPEFKAELYKISCHVNERKDRTDYIYVSSNGDFFYPRQQKWYGKFKKIDLNDLPEL